MTARGGRLHQGQPVLVAGTPLAEARAALILVHGRGASAEDILSIAADVDGPGFAYLAPQAANNTWYPYPFMEPTARNEPWLSSALQGLADLFALVGAHVPVEKTILVGFSQGACLSSEFVARNARRYGGLTAFSGGLIGPDSTPRNYPGSLNGTPVFLGCSDIDFHIPKERVLLSGRVLAELGGDVTTKLYPNMGHMVNQDEIDHLQRMMQALTAADQA